MKLGVNFRSRRAKVLGREVSVEGREFGGAGKLAREERRGRLGENVDDLAVGAKFLKTSTLARSAGPTNPPSGIEGAARVL